MKITLTDVKHLTTDKEGKTLVTKTGKPYTRTLIKCEEYPKTISGFGNNENASWKAGDEIDLLITEVGQYLNFSIPKKTDVMEDKLARLEMRIERLENIEKERQNKDTEDIDDGFQPNDVAF